MLKTFLGFYVRRCFSTARILRNSEKNVEKAKPEEPDSSASYQSIMLNFTPSSFEKKILVWSGRFKSESEIPPKISYGTLENAKSRFRIRFANLLMFLCMCMCGFYVWLGKKKQSSGDSLIKQAKLYESQVRASNTQNKGEQ